MKKKKRVGKSKEAGKISEVIWSVFFWLWLSIGILILFWILYWYIQMIVFQGLGVIAIAVIFASGVYLLAIYLGITILMFLVLGVVKSVRRFK